MTRYPCPKCPPGQTGCDWCDRSRRGQPTDAERIEKARAFCLARNSQYRELLEEHHAHAASSMSIWLGEDKAEAQRQAFVCLAQAAAQGEGFRWLAEMVRGFAQAYWEAFPEADPVQGP